MTTTAGGGPSSASTEKLAGAGSAQALAAAQSLGKPVESTQPGGEVATSVGSGAPASSASEAGAAKREPPASAPGAQGPAVAAEQQASQGEQQGAAPTGPWSKRKRIGEMEISSGVNQNQFPLLHQHILRRKESHNATEQKRRQRINDKLMELKEILPDGREMSVDKATVLNKAIDYIKSLQTQVEKAELDRRETERQLKLLQAEKLQADALLLPPRKKPIEEAGTAASL